MSMLEVDYGWNDFRKLNVDNAKLREQNAKLRELVVRMRPICMKGKRCTFADRIYISDTMEELGIEVE